MIASAHRHALAIVLGTIACIANATTSNAAQPPQTPANPPAVLAAVYVDSKLGQETNPGTEEAPVRSIAQAAEILRRRDNPFYVMRLKPGIHVVDRPVPLATGKDMSGRRLIVEAGTLPDAADWTPEKMPIVINTSGFGEVSPDAASFVVSLLVDQSHITIRGIKFHGYFRPNSRYFPIARANKGAADLLVERCLFVGDRNAAHIQVGVIAHGNGVRVDHCVFFNARNAVVFWEDADGTPKTGNEFTHNIVVGADQCAVWTAWPDKEFVFRNNIVTGCKHVWIRNAANSARYAMEDSIVVDNSNATGVAHENGVQPEPFDLGEHNVVKTGEVTLRLVTELDQPLPRDYLHPLPGTLGHDLPAGLFGE